MKKNKFLFIFFVILIFSLISCRNSNDSDSNGNSSVVNDTYYTITFDTNGGSIIDSQLVKQGEKVSIPINPVKEGCIFNSWLNDGKKYNFSNSIKSDLTLVAEWTKLNYALNLKCNKSNVANLNGAGMYYYKDEVTISANVNPGYTFIGWYEGDNEVSKDESYTFVMPSKSISYEARIIAGTDIPYKVEHYLQNVDNDEYTLYETDTYYGKVDNTTIALVKEYDEYISPNQTTCVINGDGTTVVRYLYDRVKYALTLKCNGEVIEVKDYKIGETVTICEQKYGGIGCVFDGWYVGDNLVSSEANYTFQMPDHNVEYVVKYIIDEELDLFDYELTKTTCTITGIKDKNVTSILVPEYVTNIELGAFEGCGSLESITIPFIGDQRHKSSDKFQYPLGYIFGTKSYDGGILTRQYYYGASENSYSDYCIPSSLKEVKISNCDYIQYGAFYNLIYLESISLSSEVIKIQDNTFYNCAGLLDIYFDGDIKDWCNITFNSSESNPMYYAQNFYIIDENGEREHQGHKYSLLEELVIPDGIRSIGQYQFYRFNQLKSVEISNSVTSIGNYAFANCSNLISIIIPLSVKKIGTGSFNMCNGLTSVYYKGDVADWCNITFNSSESNPMYYAQNFYIIDENGEREYQGHKYSLLEELVIPNGIRSIGQYQFYGFNQLKTVEISNGVTSIGISSFSGCSSLISITIPFVGGSKTTNTYFGYIFGAGSYYNNSSYIPASLKEVIILKGCTSIEGGAFYNCSNLESVYYKGSIKDWCNITFNGSESNPMCYAQNFYIIDENGEREYQGHKYSLLEELVIPDGIRSIGQYQFYRFNQLKTVEISNSVTSIGSSAFSGCSSLTSVTIPSSVTSIGEYAFSNCSNLISIIIPNSVTSIGKYAFNINLESVYYKGDIADWCNITFSSVQSNPMYYAQNFYIIDENGEREYQGYKYSLLEELVIPQNVGIITRIGNYQFYGFNQLKTAKISNSVTSIGYSAFSNCSNLENVIIPNSVTSIGISSFSGCSSLISITIPFVGGSETSNTYLGYLFGANSYSENSSYVPASLKEVIILQGCTSIGSTAFYKCSNIENVVIPSSVTSIGGSAFSGCSSLTSVTIPSSVTSIGSYAFANCSNLISITIPSSVKIIGTVAFNMCNGLTSVYYKGDIADWCNITFDSYSYGSNPMSYAQNFYILDENGEKEYQGNKYSLLEELVIPDGIRSIGNYQFYRFNQLKSVEISNSVTSIGIGSFSVCINIAKVYYYGNVNDWNNIDLKSGNTYLTDATIYYYSETQPTDTGNYWHYVNGIVVEW